VDVSGTRGKDAEDFLNPRKRRQTRDDHDLSQKRRSFGVAMNEREAWPPPETRSTRNMLLQLLHARSPMSYQRTLAVASLARAVADRMGLEGRHLDEVVWAAELCNVGSLGLQSDMAAAGGNPRAIAGRVLALDPVLLRVATIIAAIDERWDGTGQPDGLAGREIPVGARIIAPCEVLIGALADNDAGGATIGEVFEAITAAAGTAYDPAIVESLVPVFRAGMGGFVPPTLGVLR
jgi:two-component system, cell cycle response regulator